MKKILLFSLLLCFGNALFAQNEIKVMCYNLLTFPEEGGADRVDTLKKILNYYQPDLFLVQELKSEAGLADIVTMMNSSLGNEFQSGTYVPQISNPSNDWRLQQNIIFNKTRFKLDSETTVTTDYRDVNYFKLEILDLDASNSNDPFLHVYVTHLKSSSGSSNEQTRLGMTEFLYDHIRDLPLNSKILVGGDFNVYYGGEPAYEKLLSSNGSNTLQDPINMPNWASNGFNNFEIFTQSTRSNSPGNGAGGGLDDRFDFVLASQTLMNDQSDLYYITDTYKALGNNGTCYNQDLLDCHENNPVPFDMIWTLRNMSDHLPVVFSLGINAATSNQSLSENSLLKINPNPMSDFISLSWEGDLPIQLNWFDTNGRLIKSQVLNSSTNSLPTHFLSSGINALQILDLVNKTQMVRTLVKE